MIPVLANILNWLMGLDERMWLGVAGDVWSVSLDVF